MADPADADPEGAEPDSAQPAEAGPTEATPTEAASTEAASTEAATTEAATTEAGPTGNKPTEAAGAGARRRKWLRALTEVGVMLVMAALLAFLVRTFVFQPFWIPSASMTPTLGVYDRILVQKAFFSWHDVHEGDIVVFSQPPLDHCPGPPGDLVKRVIALPGQTIYSSGGTIYIDGRPLAEPYLPSYDPLGLAIPDASRQHPFRVPPGEFYVLGDNRADSCDSRFWGPITGSSIVGKVVLTFWHDGHPAFHRF